MPKKFACRLWVGKNIRTSKENLKSYRGENFCSFKPKFVFKRDASDVLWFLSADCLFKRWICTLLFVLFTQSGLICMLEAADLDKVDQVLPNLGAIVDVICKTEESADIARLYTSYCDLHHIIFGRYRNLLWSDSDLQIWGKNICLFNELGTRIFGSYQVSAIMTPKGHLRDYLVESVVQVGGVEYPHGEIFERSDRLFKRVRKRLSRRKL